MDTLPKELESVAVVRFQDCDPFGHLNNVRYIDYFLNARQDQLAQYYDFHLFDTFKQTQQGWVVTKTQIAYLAPAQLMEEVLIRTRLIHADESTLAVEGVMLDREGKRVKAVSWIEFVFVSTVTGRRATHDGAFMAFLRSVLVEGICDETQDFDQRVEQFKGRRRMEAALAQTSEAQMER